MTSVWSLPGPARFAAALSARLDRGYSVIVGLPGWILSDAVFRAGLLGAVDRAADVVDDCENGSLPGLFLAERFSIEDIRPGPDAAAALARHETLSGRVLAVMLADGPEQRDRWVKFVRPFVAASRSVPVTERPLLMILSGSSTASWADGDPLLSDIWWWGVLDRLDTALHVKRRLADGGEELLRDSITEVAGFDLRLADHLAVTWDGADSTLADALACFSGPVMAASPGRPPQPQSSTSLSAPPAKLLPTWEQGLVDRWDVFPVYWHACASLTAADLRSRVWRAQIRALMPTIDEERARVEGWLRQHVTSLPADTVLEPKDLYTLLQQYPHLKTWRGGHRKRLIYWLRDSRNTLAHMGVLTPGEVAHGRQLIRADRRA